MEKVQKHNYPFILRIIQAINYIAVVLSALLASGYLFASKDLLLEINDGTEPINRYIVAAGYLGIVAVVGYVLYKFKKRDKYAPEYYILGYVLGFAIFEIIYHFSNYNPLLYEYMIDYTLGVAIMAYLLFNDDVKTYFGKR